ncbi:MAG: NAD(P)H-dependent oxidoreductase [Eubacterium sp.]|nr:NAD(P)H-dependent oxidoreductase [Eubacterium sp.]
MGKTVLLLTASPLGPASVSQRMADACAETVGEIYPAATLIRRDLSAIPFPAMDREAVNYLDGRETALDAETTALMDDLCQEFMAADIYVFALPHWNLCVPPAVLSYSLCTMRAGKAFKYTEAGPVGLLQNKQALILLASGGDCDTDNPIMHCYGVDWLKGILGLCGVKKVDVVYAQGMEGRPEAAEDIVRQALWDTRAFVKKARWL